MDNLLKCPFCGAPAEIYSPKPIRQRAWERYKVPKEAVDIVAERRPRYRHGKNGMQCCWEFFVPEYVPRCTVSSCLGRNHKRFKNKEAAVKAWNTRADFSMGGRIENA